MPFSGNRADDCGPAVALHPAADRLGDALAVDRRRPGVEPGTAVADEHGHPLRLGLDEDRDRLCSRPLRGVDGRLAARGQERFQLVVERGVPDSHGVDGDPVGRFDLAFDLLDRGRQRRRALRAERARGPALEQPRAQFSLLGTGQPCHLLGLVGRALDHGKSLQHRVVDAGGHVRTLLGTNTRLTLAHEVEADPQPPGPEQDHRGRDHEQDPAVGP